MYSQRTDWLVLQRETRSIDGKTSCVAPDALKACSPQVKRHSRQLSLNSKWTLCNPAHFSTECRRTSPQLCTIGSRENSFQYTSSSPSNFCHLFPSTPQNIYYKRCTFCIVCESRIYLCDKKTLLIGTVGKFTSFTSDVTDLFKIFKSREHSFATRVTLLSTIYSTALLTSKLKLHHCCKWLILLLCLFCSVFIWWSWC